MRSCIFYLIMPFSSSCLFTFPTQFTHLHQTLFAFKNPKNESLINTHTYCTKNNWLNFDENVTAIDKEEWKEDDVKEFTKLVQQSERAWEHPKEEIE